MHDVIHRRIHLLRGHRPLVQRAHETRQQFIATELGAIAVLLYHLGQTQLHRFISGEALVALEATAATAYPVAFLVTRESITLVSSALQKGHFML